MNRRYQASQYLEWVEKLRAILEDFSLTQGNVPWNSGTQRNLIVRLGGFNIFCFINVESERANSSKPADPDLIRLGPRAVRIMIQ